LVVEEIREKSKTSWNLMKRSYNLPEAMGYSKSKYAMISNT
jgi:hypothetical protein